MDELELRPGDVVAGKYKVEKVLGAGGMGVVVSARHIALGNLVAIKLMQARAVTVKGAVERFLREGQAAALLQSKHVTKVMDVGQLESGAPYMIMEHLSGRDLAAVLEKTGAVSLPDAAEYLLQACEAIGEAHSKGIVHRDLKPANLFLQIEPDGAPLIKVLDFGIAKMSGSEQGLTGTSQGMGSGGYMSPEQMSSAKKVDHRADIWALGVTLYELVSAHRPFEADSLEQFVTRVFWEQPTPLSTHRPDLPRELEAIVLRCLEKQPDARFSSVAHFAQLIAPYAPVRAHGYVARVAKLLGVDAPNMAQTNPAMALSAGGHGAVPTAFGPAPAMAVAAPAAGYGAATGSAVVGAPHAGYGGVAQQTGQRPGVAPQTGPHGSMQPQTGPQPAFAPQTGPHPMSPQTGPHGGMQPQTGPQPAFAPQTGPHGGMQSQTGQHGPMQPQTGPHGAMAQANPMGASASGPYAAQVHPSGYVPGTTDLTGERLQPPAPKKPPFALFAVLGLATVAGGAFGLWMLLRAGSADPNASGALATPATTASATASETPPGDTGSTASSAATTASSAEADTPPATPSGEPTASPATTVSTNPIKPTKGVASAKPSAKPVATTAPAAPTVKPVGIGGTRN